MSRKFGIPMTGWPTEAVKMETFRFTEEVLFEKCVEGGNIA